ncbi:MAG: AMP-binding protein [Actinomycetota bacterium]
MSPNIAGSLDRTAARVPETVAITFEGRSVTFGDLDRGARRMSAALQRGGVTHGDRVAIWLPNHPFFAETMYGAWRCGATVVPVHSALTSPEARHILSDAGAKVLVCGEVQIGGASDLVGNVAGLEQIVVVGSPPSGTTGYESFTADGQDAPAVSELADDDLALIAYTAGTSGLPKGAMLTHANLRANLEQMRRVTVAIRSDDVVLCILPLFHIFGLNVVLNLAVDVGARLVLFERFDPKSSIEAIRTEGVTVIAGAPPAYVAWLAVADAPADAFAPVRVAISGAAPLPKEVLSGFEQRFGVTIWEGYGLTETAPALTSTAVGGVAKPGSIGRALPDVEIRLVDEDGDDVEEGDPGEVIVRGPNVFLGYWNQPEESGRVLRDGWFHTGDVAVADDDGDLFIVDRRRDLILVSGFNVYPREVGDVLRRHPNVGDCAVVGEPDPRTGESVRAIVVVDPPGKSVTTDELLEFCRLSLAPYKVPTIVDIVPEIPRNAAGKVLRRVLRHT